MNNQSPVKTQIAAKGAPLAIKVKKKIESLQSLRLLASLGVLEYHLWNNYLDVPFGHPGTDFFLVLVGAVAALSQTRGISEGKWRNYVLSRIVRLYATYIPLFFITLSVKWEMVTWDLAWRSFLFVPIPGSMPVIGCTWMLSYFALFYLLFSLAFLARREFFLLPVFTGWALAITAFNWLGWQTGIPDHWESVLLAERNLNMIMGYTAGVALRNQWVNLRWGRALLWIGIIGTAGGTLLLNIIASESNRSLYLGLPVALFVLGLGVLERSNTPSRIVRALTKPWLVWLGGTSYALYLSHPLFLHAWSRLLPVTPWTVPLITLGAVSVSVVITVLWEQPLINLLKVRLGLEKEQSPRSLSPLPEARISP